jgi:NCS1 family nucleobase:cation symporter-1
VANRLRRRKLNVHALYDSTGEYGRWNRAGQLALVLAVLPNVPGFLAATNTIAKESVPTLLAVSYDYAWFIGFALAFVFYIIFARLFTK